MYKSFFFKKSSCSASGDLYFSFHRDKKKYTYIQSAAPLKGSQPVSQVAPLFPNNDNQNILAQFVWSDATFYYFLFHIFILNKPFIFIWCCTKGARIYSMSFLASWIIKYGCNLGNRIKNLLIGVLWIYCIFGWWWSRSVVTWSGCIRVHRFSALWLNCNGNI